MRVMILANNDVGLYKFRKNLIQELLKVHRVFLSLPYGELVEPLQEMGCVFFDTPMERRGMDPRKDMKLFLAYRRLLKETAPDLVITYTVKPNVYGGLAARLAGIPYAVNITGLGTAFQKEGLLRRFVTRLYRAGCKKAKVVFFENAEDRQVFLDAGIVSEPRTCLLNGAGVDLDQYGVMEYPLDMTPTRFLFIGRVMEEKGIDEVFAAMKRLVSEGVPCILDVVGPYEENYKDLMDKYQKEGWLQYHGYQSDVRPFIAKSHCFVLPSWHEGMANTNLEAAASGRPVITSNIYGCQEAVEDGISGFLCERKNAEDLYRVMKRFLDLPREQRRQMGLAGRKRMEEVFDKKKVVDQTVRRLFAEETVC